MPDKTEAVVMDYEKKAVDLLDWLYAHSNRPVEDRVAYIASAIRDETKELRDILKEIEWAGHDGDCPLCNGDYTGGHRKNCKLARALSGEK